MKQVEIYNKVKFDIQMIKKFIISFLFIICSLTLHALQSQSEDHMFLFTNLIILLMSSILICFGDKYNYSINKNVYVFIYFFFGISPLLQHDKKIKFWTELPIGYNYYIKLNIIIILIIIIYQFCYFFFNTKSKVNQNIYNILIKFKIENIKIKKSRLVIISILSFFIILENIDFNLKYLYLKNIYSLESSKMKLLILNHFIAVIPVVCLLIHKLSKDRNRKIEIVLLFIVLSCNFPTILARNMVAQIYIPIFIVYFKSLRNFFILPGIVSVGLIYVFPFLNQFRYKNIIDKIKFKVDLDMFLQAHFDAYQNFLRLLEFRIQTNGQQLLGTILFFIPRQFWQDKPIGSGAFLAQKLNFSFSNISMPYFAEGYINFGYLGIIFFTILFAYINAKLDKFFWIYSLKTYCSIVYLFYFSIVIFLLRGDLLSSFSYFIGSLLAIIFVLKFCLIEI